MDILVYGGGAVGLGIGSCLIKSGARVTILAREETRRALSEHGLVREGIFGEHHAPPGTFGVVSGLDECEGDAYDFILVCTKSFDTENAAHDLADHGRLLGENGRVVLFQNGWGNAETMASRIPKEIVYSARVITGFIRPLPHKVVITVHADAIHAGSLFSGSPCEELLPLCEAITNGGIECINVRNVGKDIWAKMLYNCALNPLGAIFSVPYGALALHDESRAIMDSIVREVYSVMQNHGYETLWKTPEEYCAVFYADLVRLTAAHESSMLQDLRAGRRTEIDALNGAVVRLSKNPGQETPVNLTVSRMIGFISLLNRTRG
jgi:2-dehydropantoate 2-reductase